jgi:hypothetical protein
LHFVNLFVLHLQYMKRRFAIFNLVLMAVVLLATAYQSFHAFSHKHFEGHLHEHHELKKQAEQFSGVDDHHEEEDDCLVCDFHFDYFVAPQEFYLKLDFPFQHIPYTFNSIEGTASFAGSLFALRAPPVV